jgi:hypothetical protein
MKRCTGRGMGEGAWSFHALSRLFSFLHPLHSQLSAALQSLCFGILHCKGMMTGTLGGNTWQGLSIQILLGLSGQHSFLQDIWQGPCGLSWPAPRQKFWGKITVSITLIGEEKFWSLWNALEREPWSKTKK